MRIRRVRPDPGVGQGVERQLRYEIEVVVLTGVDLPGEALLERTARVEGAELGADRGIWRAENVLGAYRKRRSAVKRRKRSDAAYDVAPKGACVVRLRKAAAHSDYRYWCAFHRR